MKLFFISDIHGSLPCLQEALGQFEKSKSDFLIILGDTLYHGPRNPIPDGYDPASCATLLNQYKEKIISVRGNCDSEVDQMLIDYPISDTGATLLVDGFRFYLSHGHIFNPDNLPPLSQGDIFCFGHIHLPVAEKQDGIVVFNPGSITLPKQNNPHSYGIYENRQLKVISFEGDELASCTL